MPGVDKPGVSQHCANCERLARELAALRAGIEAVISDAEELLAYGEFGPEYFTGCLGDAEALREAIEDYKTAALRAKGMLEG